uniref:Stonin 2 n=1 Tax=Suricata suricatta TaxID=37032 RepID=A0A673T4K4_SURSU
MTTLDHVIATHQSEWVSFNEETVFPVPSEGGTEEHLPGLSSYSGRSDSSSGENRVAHGGSQELSHSEQDDSSEKLGLISEAASPPGSPAQPPPDLASAISNWVQFEDDTPWASTAPPPKETRETGGQLRRALTEACAHRGEARGAAGCRVPGAVRHRPRAGRHWRRPHLATHG